jgi:transketolase
MSTQTAASERGSGGRALIDERSMSGEGYRSLQGGLIEFGRGLADLADRDQRIVAGSADLTVSTLLVEFAQRHPTRYFQFGISERNMVSAAAGMASTGLRPYVSTFASFASLMCIEQIRTDLAYPEMPVRVIATHAGLALGFLATSHHATEDLSALRGIANLMVLSPADGACGVALAAASVDHPGPIYFRLGRGRDEGTYPVVPDGYRPGAPHVARMGRDLLIVATGIMVTRSLQAANALAAMGVEATVVDVHTIRPFPSERLAELAAGHPAVLVVEEHNTEGGLGTMVAEALGLAGVVVPLAKHGIPDEYAIIGPPHHQYRYYGLDPDGISTVGQRLLGVLDTPGRRGPVGRLWHAEDRDRILREHA